MLTPIHTHVALELQVIDLSLGAASVPEQEVRKEDSCCITPFNRRLLKAARFGCVIIAAQHSFPRKIGWSSSSLSRFVMQWKRKPNGVGEGSESAESITELPFMTMEGEKELAASSPCVLPFHVDLLLRKYSVHQDVKERLTGQLEAPFGK